MLLMLLYRSSSIRRSALFGRPPHTADRGMIHATHSSSPRFGRPSGSGLKRFGLCARLSDAPNPYTHRKHPQLRSPKEQVPCFGCKRSRVQIPAVRPNVSNIHSLPLDRTISPSARKVTKLLNRWPVSRSSDNKPNGTPSCEFYPILGKQDRASPCVNHLPGHVPRRITGEEDYYTRGVIGLIDYRHSRRYGPFASH